MGTGQLLNLSDGSGAIGATIFRRPCYSLQGKLCPHQLTVKSKFHYACPTRSVRDSGLLEPPTTATSLRTLSGRIALSVQSRHMDFVPGSGRVTDKVHGSVYSGI